MKLFALLITWLNILACLAGCQSMPQPSPGMAALRVNVIAEPKSGYKSADSVSVYDNIGSSPSLGEGAYERVNYSALDEIVVWAEPSGAGGGSRATATIDVNAAKPSRNVDRAVAIGQRIVLRNQGTKPANIYSVSDGNEFDLGTIPAGGAGEYTIKSAGVIEILCLGAKEPVALIYAAPTGWVSLTRSGKSVDFNDLPPGQCRVFSWHPRLPGSETSVLLSPNQVGTASIRVGVNALPKVAPR